MRFILLLLVIFTLVYSLCIPNLDMFRLDCKLSRRIGEELVYINPFLANFPILCFCGFIKTKGFLVFSGDTKWEN